LIPMMIWYRAVPNWHVCFLPAFVALAFFASLGPGLWITAVNVKYRDFRYVIPFLIQFGMYVSPVAYTTAVIPEKWRALYSLNPVVGIIDGFRWCLLGDQFPIYWPGLLASIGMTVFFLWLGIRKFRQMEKSFADII
jgi:lipopolysaccharide transport system permease protein